MRLILSLFLTILFALPAWAVAPQPTMQQTIQSNGVPAYSAPLWQPNFYSATPTRKYFAWNIASVVALTYIAVGATDALNVVGSGSIASGTDANGTFTKPTSFATTGNACITSCTTIRQTQLQLGPIYYCFFETPSSFTNTREWYGLVSATGLSASDTFGTTQGVALRFSTSASDTTWEIVSSDGSTQITTASSVTPVVSTPYVLAIDCSSGSQAAYYLNGQLLGSISTNLPSGSQALEPYTSITTLANTATSYKIGTQVITSN